jgi:hypothetical protein
VNPPLFSGKEGSKVLILGNHLSETSAVTFNGVLAKFAVESDTHLSAVVPSGATSGWIKVTTASGAVTGRKIFNVKR